MEVWRYGGEHGGRYVAEQLLLGRPRRLLPLEVSAPARQRLRGAVEPRERGLARADGGGARAQLPPQIVQGCDE